MTLFQKLFKKSCGHSQYAPECRDCRQYDYYQQRWSELSTVWLFVGPAVVIVLLLKSLGVI